MISNRSLMFNVMNQRTNFGDVFDFVLRTKQSLPNDHAKLAQEWSLDRAGDSTGHPCSAVTVSRVFVSVILKRVPSLVQKPRLCKQPQSRCL